VTEGNFDDIRVHSGVANSKTIAWISGSAEQRGKQLIEVSSLKLEPQICEEKSSNTVTARCEGTRKHNLGAADRHSVDDVNSSSELDLLVGTLCQDAAMIGRKM
jgi:hypothetical protein